MVKMKKLLCILLLISSTILPLVGCKAKAPLIEEELYALDTIITMSVYSADEEAVNAAKAEIKRLESLLSVTNPESDISRINTSPDTFVKVSEDTFNLVKSAIAVSESTKGTFDITIYPAVKLWGFTTSDYKVPDNNELLEVKSKIDYNKIELDESTKSVKVPKGTSLDLGGIAKGYIADKAAEVLINKGLTSALLNFGGNIRLIGSKPDNSSFKLGIKAPFTEGYFAVLKAQDVTASTAGGYERYFEENGKRYHHILNPETASPAETDVISATVVGKNGEVCDALSTVTFINGSSGVEELSEMYPDYGFIALTDTEVYISESLVKDFELTENYKNTEIKII